MKRSALNSEFSCAGRVETPGFDGSVQRRLFPGKVSERRLSVLSAFASFAVIISLSGSLDMALAADDPAVAARASQSASLEIPGSFKDLPEAKDVVTAKHLPEGIGSVTPTDSAARLAIDAEKSARTSATAYSEAASYTEAELVDFHATAYCLKGRTASGINTRPGVIAADPSVLPIGTVVHLRAGRYTGTYQVMDTGGRIKGKRVDVYVPTHKEAREFGRRQVKIKVIGSASRTTKTVLASGL